MDGVDTIEVDLTAGGALPPGLLRRLDHHAAETIVPFNEMIARLSIGYEHNIDWWVSRPASRNTFVGDLFNRCTQILLIQDLLCEHRVVRVRTDDAALAAVLRSLQDTKLEITISARRRRKQLVLQHLWDISSSIFHCAAASVAARLTRPRACTASAKIAIDVFVSRDDFSEGAFRDRYFPGLLGWLGPQHKHAICYVPMFYRIRNYWTLFRNIRRSPTHFLVPQDHLKWADYAFAFGHWWRVRRLLWLDVEFTGLHLAPLIRAELECGRFAQSSIAALLAYRFWSRIGKVAPELTDVIDWYEGQAIDHATAAALNWTKVSTRLTGFLPPCSKLELSVTPAKHEVAAGVVPSTMAVVGRGFRRNLASEIPELRTIVAPGLRHQQLSSFSSRRDEARATILAAFPLQPPLATRMGQIAIECMAAHPSSARRWLLKRHPAMPQSELDRLLLGTLPAGAELIDGSFYDWLPHASVVIGTESSALLEAIAVGVPALCVAMGNIPTKIPFPDWADRTLWRVCYDADEINNCIDDLLAQKDDRKDAGQLLNDLLSPATADSIAELLHFSRGPEKV
ncbi:MAG: hypothetical protein KGL97_06085 [Alphaproteobacteria bacterium]|nr:hypothetical protein [Alphaproteobacteria bacterium]